MSDAGLGLQKYDAMVLAIDAAERVDEVKDIRDQARAFEVWARQALNKEAEAKAARIRIRAEKKTGELLREAKRSGQRRDATQGRPKASDDTTLISPVTKLSDLGVSRDQSSQWQQLADIPKETFEKALAADKVPTTQGVLRTIKVEENHKRRDSIAEGEEDTCTVTDLELLGGREFGTVYADPPWLYGNQGTRASTGNHYSGMTVDDICALPVEAAVAENAHLHLWTTNGFLAASMRVIEAWGFEYKSCFVWVKPQMGIGNYWRVSHEFMLLGVRGTAPFRNRSLMSWGQFDRTRHSAKPEAVRAQIESASPGPYLELFGRRPATGWTVWGNEIKRTMFETCYLERNEWQMFSSEGSNA
jgi:N6-adenosine-specific RNA methylase IME4